jgi:hypothetical protein
MAKEQTEKAIAAVTQEPGQQSGANPAKGGKTTDDNGVEAVVNPELGNVQSVSFPDGEGGADSYANGATHVVPEALLEVKNVKGIAYLVKKDS